MDFSKHLLGLTIAFTSVLTAQQTEPHSLAALLSNRGFVRIPAGEFSMGSTIGNPDELPVRRVKIPKAFQMSKYEVTQAQWNAIMSDPHAAPFTSAGAVDVNPSHFKGDTRPVENVSWEAVQVFINVLNKRDPKHTYRLPTEAEWEYAAKAGSKTDAPPEPDSVAWYQPNSGGETHDVGQKAPNAWGLYDMLGNVFEWVDDWYTPESYASGTAAQPANPRSYKVYRGCGWLSERKYCRPAFRMFDFPTQGQYSTGFRLVRIPK